jgi:hypothetical protein
MLNKSKAPTPTQSPSSKEIPKYISSSIENVYMAEKQESFLIDGISAIAIHNGVARIQFMRLGFDGKPMNSHVIEIPMSAVKSVIEALNKVR